MNLRKSSLILFAFCAMTTSSFASDLFTAIDEGSSDAVEEALKSTADINAKDKFGRTALHKAINKGDVEIIEMIIAKGADVNAKDVKGETPLHTAAWKENEELMTLLVGKKADPSLTNSYGQTAQEIVFMLKAMPSPVNNAQNATILETSGVCYDYRAKMNDMENRDPGIDGFNLTTGKYLNKARDSYFLFEKDMTAVFSDPKKGEVKGTYTVEGRYVYLKLKNMTRKLKVINFTELQDCYSGILFNLAQ